MTVVNFNYPKFKYTIATTGQPGVGYKLFTYEEGTSTKKTTWTSLAKTAANTNPIILDANGECDVWIDGNYKFVLAPPTDTDPPASAVWTYDAVRSTDTAAAASAAAISIPSNGSFETDTDADGTPDDWTLVEYTGGTVAIDATVSSHGVNSLKFTSTGSGGGSASTNSFYEVEAGENVGVRFTIISANANTHNKVEISWYTAAQLFLSTTAVYDDAATNPVALTRKYLNATAPATAKYAKIILTGVAPDSVAHSTTNFDNIELDTTFSGAITATPTELNTLEGITSSTAELNVLDGIPATLTATELGYVDGVTSSIQTQINNLNTTSSVLSLIAGATEGAVGTYVLARRATPVVPPGTDTAFGGTLAGSSLYSTSATYSTLILGNGSPAFTLGAALSGTWRAMGTYDDVAQDGSVSILGVTLWLRIS